MRIDASVSRARKPIQIQSEALRNWHSPAPSLAGWSFPVLSDEPVKDEQQDKLHSEAGWRDADLKRAIAVAEKAELKSYRIEIAADGTISILVGNAVQGASSSEG